MPAGRDHQGIELVGDLHQPALAGRSHLGAPTLALFGQVWPGLGVDEREAGHPLRRLAQDLEGGVAAHGQAHEHETWGRVGQDAAGDAGHAVVAGVIRHHHRSKAPERRDLGRVELGRAEQAGDQDDRQGSAHALAPFSPPGPAPRRRMAPRPRPAGPTAPRRRRPAPRSA